MKEDVARAVAILRRGGLILYPTDTVWGIGCDATNPEAVQKAYRLKQREENRSMIVLLPDVGMLPQYVAEVPEIAWQLAEVADSPLTLIYPGAKNLASNLIAADGTVGIRVVRDDFCTELLRDFRRPVVSTSANISGRPSPALFGEIEASIVERVDYVVKWRQNDTIPAKPSSIIKLTVNGEFSIIRP